ncbi:MAG: DUF504 domain-containing protein [Gammaproteobacteria bacterium]|nr:DUF504 domain-containing protein [Gammaproteobacteria bacterium]
MQPIQDLLNRIRWDPAFGQGRFEVAFLDHLERELVRLPLAAVIFAPGDHYFFHYVDVEGLAHSVPFHRIKAVYKNGELIWQRRH